MTGGRTGGAAVTLADVARLAGVSLATASRALHGSGDRTVRPDLASRVLAAAAQLRYTPNASARAMVRGRTDVVGLVVHDVADPYFSSIADGVMRAAEAHGLVVTMASTRRDPAREIRYVATLRQQRVRGLILAGTRIRGAGDALATELEAYQAGGGRVAMISQRQLPVDTVVVANRAGASDLAAALVDRGYRRFAVLAGPRELITARDRYAGFRAGLTGAASPSPRCATASSPATAATRECSSCSTTGCHRAACSRSTT